MHPNAFLRTFWRMDLKPQVFVAMRFAARYTSRFTSIIAPAIESIQIGDIPLKAYRVDASKSGDSILTDIVQGIAHSQMVLADVSTFGKDSQTGQPYRNGNVMYEVGIALACRQPQEVLLIRDDADSFLFDVSTIPHMTLDVRDQHAARRRLSEELRTRLRERDLVNDARVQLAIAGLSGEEVRVLRFMDARGPEGLWGPPKGGFFPDLLSALSRLLDKGLIVLAGTFTAGNPAYRLTLIGAAVAKVVQSGLSQSVPDAQAGLSPGEKRPYGPYLA